MNDEPLDLMSLASADAQGITPDVAAAAIRRFRRRVLVRSAWTFIFIAAIGSILASRVVSENRDIAARIAEGPIHQGREGYYEVAGLDVGLVKVTVLPGDRYGMRFIIFSPQPAKTVCCFLQLDEGPDIEGQFTGEGASGSRPHFLAVDYAVPEAAGRKIDFELVDQQGESHGRITVDLDALDVPPIGG